MEQQDNYVDVIDRLARIEEKLDVVKDHETRLRSLETSTSKLLGVGIITSILAGIAGPHLIERLSGG